MKLNSLEARLQVGLGISLLLLIAAAWWLGYDALHRSAGAQVLSRLKHDSEALLGTLSQTQARIDEHRDGMIPIYQQPFSGHYFKVVGGEQPLRSRSLWDRDFDVPVVAVGQMAHWQALGPAGQALWVRAAGYRLHERDITVAVAEDITPLLSELRDFERMFAVLAVAGLVSMVLVQHLIVRSAFALLRPTYRDIEALEHGGARRISDLVPSEILPLVSKLNGLLDVYDKRLERSRNAAGNLAHALKTPLNLIMQQLGRDSAELDGASREICREQVVRVRQLLERELRRARIAGSAAPGALFDPDRELPVLKDVLARLYPEVALDLDGAVGPDNLWAADREDMLELFGILLDNACKWATSRACWRVCRKAEGLVAFIEDDGPGCSDEALVALGERGLRLDEQVDGHGLGLSIAREIVALYGGELRFDRAHELGGFQVRVTLPIVVVPRCAQEGPPRR